MALTNVDKNTLTRLFDMINIKNNETTNYNNLLNIRSNYATYSKLELIAKQIEFLKNEALNIIDNHELNNDLNNIKCNFRKVAGTYYYLYNKEIYNNINTSENDEYKNEKIISLIGPEEWNNENYKFISKIYFDYDYQFYKVD